VRTLRDQIARGFAVGAGRIGDDRSGWAIRKRGYDPYGMPGSKARYDILRKRGIMHGHHRDAIHGQIGRGQDGENYAPPSSSANDGNIALHG